MHCGERLCNGFFRAVNTLTKIVLLFVGKLPGGHKAVISILLMAAVNPCFMMQLGHVMRHETKIEFR